MSNELGEIYGTVKDGKGSIIINSNTIDICGNLLMNGLISLCSSNEEVAAADPSGILNRINSLTNNVNILLTSNNDASFNNVDVSGTLNVQGEKVMTVPALDICGNDLSANTTYEITTGPSGSINNISFVKKREPYYLTANLTTSQNLSTSVTDVTGWTVLAATDATDFNATTGIWTCPSTGVYIANYELLIEGGHQILRIAAYIVVGGSGGWTTVRDTRVAVDNGQADDFKFMPLKVSAMRELTAGTQVKVRMNAAVAGNVWHRINGNYATHMWIQRVD